MWPDVSIAQLESDLTKFGGWWAIDLSFIQQSIASWILIKFFYK